MVGRWLCAIGFHRWEFRTTAHADGSTVTVRCRRRCRRWGLWRVVSDDPR